MSRKSRKLNRESSRRANNAKAGSNQTYGLSGKGAFFKRCEIKADTDKLVKRITDIPY